MKTWIVTLEDPIKRKARVVKILAENSDEATKKARKMGRVLSVTRSYGFSELLKPPLKMDERQILLHRLGTMIECKIGASEALKLIERNFTGAIKRVSGKLLDLVEQGEDIPSAMEKVGQPDLPKNTVALIKAGSKSGNTGLAIRHAAEFELEIEQAKKNNVWEMWFAIFGFVFAGITIFSTKFYFAPEILNSQLIKMAGTSVDTAWAMKLMNGSVVMMAVFTMLFVVLMALSTLGRIFVPIQADRIVVRIPFYKDLVLARNNYITLYALATLVQNGVPMEQSLSLAAEASPKGIMRNDLECASEAVRHGKNWAETMQYLHPTDRAALASVQDRAQSAKTLNSLSQQYRILYAQRVKATAPIFMLTSAFFLVISGMILFGLGVEPILQIAAKGVV